MIRRPNFFIVGAPKCGTTAMYRYLRAHPDIFMPDKKEPHYFGRDLDRLPTDFTDEAAYLSLFAAATSESRLGEASVWYLFSECAAEEIKTFEPDAKIIIMLRNPLEAMYSMYQHLVFAGAETLPTLRAALDAIPDRRAGRRIPPAVRRVHELRYTDMVRYTRQVQRYLDAFGADQVHSIIYDDFKNDTATAYQAALEFLEVDPSFTTRFERANVSKRIRIRWFHFLYMYVEMRMMWHAPRPVWKVYSKWVTNVLRPLNSTKAPRPPMNPDLRRQLQDEFRPEIEQLSALLDRDLTHWCADD